MHNNYYFLCQLTSELKSIIVGSSLIDSYSQNKEELILTFSGRFNLKCHLQSQFSCISAPEQVQRSNRNSITLFPQILGKKVTGISQCLNDRSFIIHFSDRFELLLKLYGNRSNIILFHGEEFQAMLKNQFERDKSINLSELDRKIDQSYEAFINSGANLELLFPTFDKKIREFIQLEGYHKSTIEQKWEIIKRTLTELNSGKYYVTQWHDAITFSLLILGNVISTDNNALQAITRFFLERLKYDRFISFKAQALRETLKEIRKLSSYINKTEKILKDLSHGPGNRMMGDLLMANLHQIPPHQQEISLPDFTDGKPITIKLKSQLSAQKNAELFYRKAKNQNIQVEMINSALESKKKVLGKFLIREEIINRAKTISGLEVFIRQDPNPDVNKTKPLPYKRFQFMGYDILVGKNAQANDKLTAQYAKKNDLWLHAKGSSGSHVVIKQKPGGNFPKPVIEKAAELAAYYSKGKGESLCQVLYTERKFVRKRKGSVAGEVIVENEKVILVEPKIEI